MPSILKRSLPILVILFGLILLANTKSGVAQQSATNATNGWTWVQDTAMVFCTGLAPATGCNIGPGQIIPTTTGSIWVLHVLTANQVTITSVTGGGGTWIHCPNCAVHNPCTAGVNGCPSTGGYSADAWYNLNGNAGTYQGINFALSGSSGAVFNVDFIEILPPPGSTASYDTSGTASPTGCTSCTAVPLTLSATDFVVIPPGSGKTADWKAWSSPYITDANGGGMGINVSNGAAPTVNFVNPANPAFMALAFKSSLGTFTPPTHQYSIANFTVFNPPTSCGTCTVTIPATGANHLLFIQSADEVSSYITSVSGGGTWVVPSGANSCRIGQVILSQNNEASCAYNLSSVAGTTSLTVTMSGNGSTNFAIWEIASAVGNFAFDAQGAVNYTTNTVYAAGPALTLSGHNDVIFSLDWTVGGSGGPTYYAQPHIASVGIVVGPYNYFLQNEASSVVLLDSALAPTTTPVWSNQQNTPTFVTGVAFTAGGTSTPPNPPTGLTAVVN